VLFQWKRDLDSICKTEREREEVGGGEEGEKEMREQRVEKIFASYISIKGLNPK
jgi:hypothetical protein